MEVAVIARHCSNLIRSVGLATALVVVGSTLTGCAGMFVKAEDPQTAGLRLYQEKNYTEAAGAFRNAVRQNPLDYKSQYYLAVALDADGRYQESVEAYRAALGVQNVTYAGQDDKPFRQK